MKHLTKSNLLLLLSAGLGIVIMMLRALLYGIALDEKNLLVAFHPLEILIWLGAAAAGVVLVLHTLARNGSNRWEDNFRPGFLPALGCFLLAAAIAAVQLPMLSSTLTLMEKLRDILGLLSIPGMVWVGICRLRGKKPFFGCHALLCVYLSVYLVSRYQSWSGNPQLQDYVFSMFACVCLALSAYHQAAFEVDSGNRRLLLLFGLLSGFFGLAAMWGEPHFLLYAAGAIWALTNLCRVNPVSRYLRSDIREN